MNMIGNLVEFFKKPEQETKDATPEGLCPVCWGYQEYDRKVRLLYRDKQVDVNNHLESRTLIRDFVINNIEGIKLKEEKVISCPTCGEPKEKKAL